MEGVRAEALGQTKLALDDLVNQLYAGQDPPSVEETLESEHRAHAAFYPPVILFGRRCSGRDSFETCRIIPAWLQSVKPSDISALMMVLLSSTSERFDRPPAKRGT
jgi:hypothetical protein